MSNNIANSIVIGGGISGLCAAYAQVKAGKSVILFEPEQLGGVLRSSSKEGFQFELGPNVFQAKPEILELLKEFRIESEIRYPIVDNFRQFVWFNGRAVPVPKGPAQFLFSPLFSISSKLRLISSFLIAKRTVQVSEDESVSKFFAKIIGEEAVQAVVDPALRGVYGGDVSSMSVRTVFSGLWEHCRRGLPLIDYIKSKKAQGKPRVFTLASGNDLLVKKLVGELEGKVRIIKAKVGRVRASSGEYRFSVVSEEGRNYYSDSVFIATASKATSAYITELSPSLSDLLTRIRHASLVVAHVVTSELSKIPVASFGILFPTKSKLRAMGIMFNSELFPHMAPDGRQLLTVCLGGVNNTEFILKTDEEISDIVKQDILVVLGIRDARILNIHRWSGVIPQPEVGHANIIEAMSAFEDEYPGIHFIGAERGGVGVPDRVASALTTVTNRYEPRRETAVGT